MSNETNNETNKPIEARELTEKELEGVVGGLKVRRGVIEELTESDSDWVEPRPRV